MTYKQLEALYWIVRLGGFGPAAKRLHATQSAVSKRIAELEQFFEVELFDRSQRSARLTEKGEELYVLARRLLAERDAAVEQFAQPEVLSRRLRLGITELTAMTWLPLLVERIGQAHPKVIVEPMVDSSPVLCARVLSDALDLAFVPEPGADARTPATVVGTVSNAWMCKPGLLDHTRRWRLKEIVGHRLLVQGLSSGTGQFYDSWMRQQGAFQTDAIEVGNLVAILGLALAGLGITYLPCECVAPLLKSGALVRLNVRPALPPLAYVALRSPERKSTVVSSVIALAQDCCDFTVMFRGGASN